MRDDQGIMFSSCQETDDLMPAPIHFSHKILRLMATIEKWLFKRNELTLKVKFDVI